MARSMRSGRPGGTSASRIGLRWMEAPSAGRTMVPISSIQTAIGMLTKPNSSPVTWRVSMRLGCVGAAASIH
jgi:hypothetical protein